MTLTEFLLARIAEDEAVAEAAREHEYLSAARDASALRWVRDSLGYGTVFANSGRVLAECQAKRRIVEMVGGGVNVHRPGDCQDCDLLRALALPFADHPDYREEGKP